MKKSSFHLCLFLLTTSLTVQAMNPEASEIDNPSSILRNSVEQEQTSIIASNTYNKGSEKPLIDKEETAKQGEVSLSIKRSSFVEYFKENARNFSNLAKKIQLNLLIASQAGVSTQNQESVKKYLGVLEIDQPYKKFLGITVNSLEGIAEQYNIYIPQICHRSMLMDETAISELTFNIYCQLIGKIKTLEQLIDELPIKGNGLQEELETAKDIMESKLKSFLLPFEQYLEAFLSAKKIGKESEYFVSLNVYDILLSQKKEVCNLYSINKKIDLNKFNIKNTHYRKTLAAELESLENQLNFSNKKVKVDASLRLLSKQNLCQSKNTFLLPGIIEINFKSINLIHQILSNPLRLEFSNGKETPIRLSEEEKQRNWPIFLEMMNSSPMLLKEQSKIQEKKKKSENKKQERSSVREQSIFQNGTTISFLEEKEIKKEPLASQQSKIEAGAFTEPLAASNGLDLSLEMQERIEQCSLFLKNLIQQASSGEGEYYGVYQKAKALLKDLNKNGEEILEEVQHASTKLALYLIEKNKKNFINVKNTLIKQQLIVSKNYEEDYLYIMTTPIRYLKNSLRFGTVRRFIEGMGGEINDAREGSRISLKLNGQTTSLHLHDSKNGLLDGGRIMSIREFVMNAGVILKE